jgi:hypothetical protein
MQIAWKICLLSCNRHHILLGDYGLHKYDCRNKFNMGKQMSNRVLLFWRLLLAIGNALYWHWTWLHDMAVWHNIDTTPWHLSLGNFMITANKALFHPKECWQQILPCYTNSVLCFIVLYAQWLPLSSASVHTCFNYKTIWHWPVLHWEQSLSLSTPNVTTGCDW